MFLMFRLHRPDVLPWVTRNPEGGSRNYGLRKMPHAERLTKIGEPWRPYRSVACWYLWASLKNLIVNGWHPWGCAT
jgi:DNA-3-methyladenine glycosylase II